MDEKESTSILNNVELSPVISTRASPAHIDLSLSSATATKISIEFTLCSSRPVTIFVYDTLLSPPPSGPNLIHRTFSFNDTISGAKYKPPIIEGMRILDYDGYMLSYTNANKFLTLYPNAPCIIDREFWPKATDGDNMEPGRSYRMYLAESAKKATFVVDVRTEMAGTSMAMVAIRSSKGYL